MVSALENVNAYKVHLQCCIWIFVAITMSSIDAQMYVGDSCTMKSEPGICKVASKCMELEVAVKSGKYSPRDIVNCGFDTHEEIICCPTAGDNEQSPLSTIFPNTITSKTPTEASNTRFDAVDTSPTPKIGVDMTTTTTQPDFWVHLLSTTSTTTTTPKPLIIRGKEIDVNQEFIDLTSMLSEKNAPGVDQFETEVVRQNQLPQMAAIRERGLDWQNPSMGMQNPSSEWNVPRQRQFPQQGMPPPQPNGGIPFRNSPRNRQQPRTGWSAGPNNIAGNAFIQQPFQTPMPTSFQSPGGDLRNMNARQPLRFPNDEITRFEPASNSLNSPQNHWGVNDNTNLEPKWQTNNDRSQINPHSESIWPNRGLQRPPNSFISAPLSPLRKVSRPTFALNNEKDPIQMVNENLKKSGIEIINAQLDNDFDDERFRKTTKAPTKTADPFAPFQFRPQSEGNFVEHAAGNSWLPESNENSEQRPVWGFAKSSKPSMDDDDGPTKPTVVTTSSTTVPPVIVRAGRPADTACREIEKNLGAGLSPHILGGVPAEIGEFPHMAAIGYATIGNEQGPYDYRCGGTLIDKRFVLTAAHCVNSRESQPAVVLLGLIDINDAEERKTAEEVPVRQVHIHPEYTNSRVYHDIAVLELAREVNYTDNIFPTCLYTNLNDPPKNSPTYVTGWGQINTRTRQKSQVLLKAKLEIVDVDSCNQSYVEVGLNRRINQGIQSQQLCAHDPGFQRDACQGDSGGPLNLVIDESLKKYRVVGVISAGFSCGSATPGLYARVAAYLDFIEGVVWPNSS